MWTKSQYDGAGRDVMDYSTDGAGGTTWSAASSVANDTVLEQVQTVYDADSNPIETIDSQRFHDATGAGALGSPTSGIWARVYYAAEYYDNVDRVIADVDAGTNGGTAWTRPGAVPSSSATLLVTTYAYSYLATGPVLDVHDPMGIDAHYNYDNLGRQTRVIQDYTGQAETTESNVSTSYFYDGDNHVAYVVANEPGGVYEQTRYVYGVTTASGSGVNSNDILSAIQHPDPTSGKASVTQQDKYLTNALGDVVQSSDRNGTVHQYSYDVLGRLTSDNVTAFGVGVDSTIQQITYGYDSQGNRSLITSLKAGGTIANQMQRFFNGLGQLTTEYQSHSGAVDIPYTPEVQYAYTEMSGGQNNSRLVSMTYPDGYQVFYNYNAGLDSNISRLSSLSDSTGTLESYLYLGLNTVVERDHPQTGINLSYIQQAGDPYANNDGGDQYTGLDRFGRIIDQFWISPNTNTTVDRYQYGYNQDSEVLYRQNLVDSAMSELYSYDNLGQLTSFQRGTLNSSHNGMVGSPSHSQSWTPDALGNFTSITTDGTAQTRTADQQNEYTSISASAPSYDADGNLTSDGNGMVYVYDAWNRLVTVKNDGTVVASYVYDGLNRRIQTSESNSLTDSYYSSSDQVLENYQGSAVTAFGVWSPVYVNALVYWARGSGAGATRYYALQDANWNVTAWVVAGTVVEREAYDPFGAVTVLSPGWGVQSSPLHLAIGFQGMGYDWLVGLNFTGERVYNPAFMRWQQTDPIGQASDVNPYRLEGNEPTNAVDPSGLAWIRRVARPDGKVLLYYVPGGLNSRFPLWTALFGEERGRFIGVLDPSTNLVTRGTYSKDLATVEGEVNSPWTTTDWDSWFKEDAADLDPTRGKNMAIAMGAWQSSRNDIAAGTVVTKDLAWQSTLHTAGAGFNASPSRFAGKLPGGVKDCPPIGAPKGEFLGEVDRVLLRQLSQGTDVVVPAGTTGIARTMTDLTLVSGNEVALLRLKDGTRVLRMGGPRTIRLGPEVERVIAHTHPRGTTRFSVADIAALQKRGQRSSVIIDPRADMPIRLPVPPRGTQP